MTAIEFGNVLFCPPLQGGALAAADEELGFDIRYFGENSCQGSDPFAELRDAARATTRIRLAVGATNFVTRHPAVIANAIAGVQLASHGRAICGVATGDSALGVIGKAPQRLVEFAADARMLRAYLNAEAVDVGGSESRIEWLATAGYSPVPVEIMCSGPRTIRAAAAIADRVTLTVGAAPERIEWALELLEQGLVDAGRSRDEVVVGAYLGVVVDDDRARAVERLRVRVKGIAHMASLPGINLGAQPASLRTVTEKLRTAYDYRHHNLRADNPLGELIPLEFADWFGIGGSPAYVVDRIGALAAAGLGYVFVGGMVGEERERFAAEVMPQLAKPSV